MNKIIILDLDGTLLKNDKTITEETINLLLKLKKHNNRIFFATARPPRDAYKYVPNHLRDNPMICYNGACIINKKKEILYKKVISRLDALKILKIANEFGYYNLCFEINDKLYSNFDTCEFFGNVPNEIVDLEQIQFDSLYKIIICSKKCIAKDLLNAISNNGKGIITDNGTLCQIMNKEVSKWTCIQEIIKKENINKKDIIAFGDDYNDYDMIKNAGIGVAMGNAEETIKEIADFVTDSNMNEGVANFIKKELLNQETDFCSK